jgi:ribonuclease HI
MKTGRCAWAVVGDIDGRKVRKTGGLVGTNQLAEMQALHEALKIVPEGNTTFAKIITDSQYAIFGITNWRRRWEDGGWVGANGKPVKYKEIWQDMHALYDRRKVQLIHVRGHRGVEGNELADALCGLQRAVDEGRASREELDRYLNGH